MKNFFNSSLPNLIHFFLTLITNIFGLYLTNLLIIIKVYPPIFRYFIKNTMLFIYIDLGLVNIINASLCYFTI
jgi:hypothetical protein